jgi:hypothetical protein
MKSDTTGKVAGAGREKKPVQETLGRVAERPNPPAKPTTQPDPETFQKKTGEIRRDFGR